MAIIDPNTRINSDSFNIDKSVEFPENFDFEQAIRGEGVQDIARLTKDQHNAIYDKAEEVVKKVYRRELSSKNAYFTLEQYINNQYGYSASDKKSAREAMKASIKEAAQVEINDRQDLIKKNGDDYNPFIPATIAERDRYALARDIIMAQLNKNWKK